jgi:hypothetical protein
MPGFLTEAFHDNFMMQHDLRPGSVGNLFTFRRFSGVIFKLFMDKVLWVLAF